MIKYSYSPQLIKQASISITKDMKTKDALIILADLLDKYGYFNISNRIDNFISLADKYVQMGQNPLPAGMQDFPFDEFLQKIEEQSYVQPEEKLPMLSPDEFSYDPDYLKQLKLKQLENARQKSLDKRKDQGVKKDFSKAIEDAIMWFDKEEFLPSSERSEQAKNVALPTLKPSDFKYDPEWYKEDQKKRRKEQGVSSQSDFEISNVLISMADKFDREGKAELAEIVDNVLQSKAARPKAPLKKLNDDVKKNLIVFLLDAEDSMTKGTSGLNELFRRMRYFDIGDSIKDLGLDRVVKEMERTQQCLDSAKKDFYVMTFGKRPSKSDLDELMEKLQKKRSGEDDGQQALDFFNSEEAQALDGSYNLDDEQAEGVKQETDNPPDWMDEDEGVYQEFLKSMNDNNEEEDEESFEDDEE